MLVSILVPWEEVFGTFLGLISIALIIRGFIIHQFFDAVCLHFLGLLLALLFLPVIFCDLKERFDHGHSSGSLSR